MNAANSSLLGGGGVDHAIHKAAGPKLFLECIKLHGCRKGEAKITKAYQLPCKYIIHTVGPVWKGGKRNEERILADCYIISLKLAEANQIHSIAFPSISTGSFKFPIDRAAQIAVNTVWQYMDVNAEIINDVTWVLYDQETESAYRKAVQSLNQSI